MLFHIVYNVEATVTYAKDELIIHVKGSGTIYDLNNTPQGQDTASPEIFAARIGFWGALLSTLGDGLQSLGAGIALKQLENPSNADTQNQSDHTTQIESMQKQIDLLTKKIEEMDRKE